MTQFSFEVPAISDLEHLPLEVVPMDELGVVSVTAFAEDGDMATLVWDEIARSVTVRWTSAAIERVRIERELAIKVSIVENEGSVEFRSWSQASDLGSELIVRVAAKVSISDALLKK